MQRSAPLFIDDAFVSRFTHYQRFEIIISAVQRIAEGAFLSYFRLRGFLIVCWSFLTPTYRVCQDDICRLSREVSTIFVAT